MSDLLKRLNFNQSDLSDCANVLERDQLYCEARVVKWTAARIRELEAQIAELEDYIKNEIAARYEDDAGIDF